MHDDHSHTHDHHHEHSHDHEHSHGSHGHHHGPALEDGVGRYSVAVALNLLFVAIGVAAGLYANSMALLADAAHNLSDALGLVAAGGATWLATKPGNHTRTYGYGKATVLAALGNAVVLILVCGGIGWEAVSRFFNPAPTQGGIVMIIAAIGVLLNGGSALMFMQGRHGDANVRGAFLHLLSDALTSAAVIVAGGLIFITHWQWIDPLVSLLVCLLIVRATWGLLAETLNLALDAVPHGVNATQVRADLAAHPQVAAVHDLHIWAMSTRENALTAHLVCPDGGDDTLLKHLSNHLQEKHGIAHITLQVEQSAQGFCPEHP